MITMNEEKAVGKVIGDIRHFAPDAEILVVDSSKDRTPEIASALGARVIRQFPPKGYGPAMEAALRSASGDVVVTLDCDDTYPADQISIMTNMVLVEGWDLVDGSRLKNKPRAMPWLNYLANAGFALLASILFGKWITDLHSGMRAYRKTMIDSLKVQAQGPALPVELLLRPLRNGSKVRFHFITYSIRIGTTTMRPLESAWWTLKRILRVRFLG
ncbi:MAG: glycosyltransferase family 2 protein [Deltaproteobacteria bacterium]|nr:glycosyltransferase family 2 protein [Deltaproteobacteria bacterium]